MIWKNWGIWSILTYLELNASFLLLKKKDVLPLTSREVLEKLPVPKRYMRQIYTLQKLTLVTVFQAQSKEFSQPIIRWPLSHSFFIVCVCGWDGLQSNVFGKCCRKQSLYHDFKYARYTVTLQRWIDKEYFPREFSHRTLFPTTTPRLEVHKTGFGPTFLWVMCVYGIFLISF